MNNSNTIFETMNISGEKVISLISELLGKYDYPGLDNLQSMGSWSPYIRKVLEQIRLFGPSPQPWQYSHINQIPPHIGSLSSPQRWIEFNSQPLPPRSVVVALLTQVVIDHALLIQEIADAINQKNNERSIIIVSGIIEKFADEFEQLCHEVFVILKKHSYNGGEEQPHPNWNDLEVKEIELFAAATILHKNARNAKNPDLRQVLQQAVRKLTELGMAKMG